MDEYRGTHRGGKGIITMRITEKTGRVIGVRMVTDDDQLMLVTSGGRGIRLRTNEIGVTGRNTQGVRLIELEEGERLAAVARLAEREEETDAGDAAPAADESAPVDEPPGEPDPEQ